MSEKVLILGGTGEAAELAARLCEEGCDVTTSLAGRTSEPKPVKGAVRTGGFGGAEGLAAYLRQGGFHLLIDATHPFAKRISANAEQAAALTGIAFEKRVRLPWKKQPGDTWIEVASLKEASDVIPSGARVLLALGSQHVAQFADRGDVHFVVRMIDPPEAPLLLPDHELVTGLPGKTPQEEADLFR
jgi:precorrin-6A/cobalt-precorrin-6A reductase